MWALTKAPVSCNSSSMLSTATCTFAQSVLRIALRMQRMHLDSGTVAGKRVARLCETTQANIQGSWKAAQRRGVSDAAGAAVAGFKLGYNSYRQTD